MSRSRNLVGFWLRLVTFSIILLVSTNYTVYVLTPKHDYGICPIMNLYRQPENSVDVLMLGSSCAYAGVNTNILFREYGVAAYNLCTAEQP